MIKIKNHQVFGRKFVWKGNAAKIGKVEKFVASLYDKKEYVVHVRNF